MTAIPTLSSVGPMFNESWNLSTLVSVTSNESFDLFLHADPHVFKVVWVRAVFITLSVIVFCACFFGNLLVIVVVTMSRRLRSITNFFLANLAIADLCVGLFCIFQNLYLLMSDSWVLGDTLCKMNQFVHSLSYTASILILVVICTERYVAIIHPITCRRILTPTRLMVVVAWAWLLAAGYSAPRLDWMKTIPFNHSGVEYTFCVPSHVGYDRELFDVLTFVLLYAIPLGAMTVLYSRIAVALWKSSHGLAGSHCHQPSIRVRFSARTPRTHSPPEADASHGVSSMHVLHARRGVVRMLIAMVLTFAVCNLPLHARKMWQYWSPTYRGDTPFSAVLTLLSFLSSYVNAAVDPLLYAFMSRNFRRGTRELLCGVPTQRTRSSSPINRQNLTRSTSLNS